MNPEVWKLPSRFANREGVDLFREENGVVHLSMVATFVAEDATLVVWRPGLEGAACRPEVLPTAF